MHTKPDTAGPLYWYANQAAAWIAYEAAADDLPRPHPKWGYGTSDDDMAALEALAAGTEWQPERPMLPEIIAMYRKRAESTLFETGLSPTEVMDMIRKEEALAKEENIRLRAAINELNNAVASGRIAAEGRPTSQGKLPATLPSHEPIPPRLYDGLREITLHDTFGVDPARPIGDWIQAGAPLHVHVRLLAADVQRLWPARSAAPAFGTDSAPIEPEMRRAVAPNRGGRPTQHDWDALWIEVALYAAGNDLQGDYRPALQRYIEDWAARTWENPPEAATIRRKLQKLYERALAQGHA